LERIRLEDETEMLRQEVKSAELETIRLQVQVSLEEQRDRYLMDE
jgi:hypothetical protein